WLPAPGPCDDAQGLHGRIRRRRRPGGLPERGTGLGGVQAVLRPRVFPRPHPGAARCARRGWRPVAVRGLDGPLGPGRPGGEGDHPDRVRGLLRPAGPRSAGARHPDRPGRVLLRRAAGDREGRLVGGGVRAGPLPGAGPDTRGRPVPRDPALTPALPALLAGPAALADGIDPEDASPGIGAFITFFILAVIILLLAWSFTRH